MLDWQKYISIADKFQYKAKVEDREDIRQDIIVRLAEVERKYNGNGKSLTEGGMVRVASYTLMDYWRKKSKLPPIISLNSTINDGEGNEIELYHMLADDKAIDLDTWIDAKLWLYRAPPRLVKIAYKRINGIRLTAKESQYLYRKMQKRLI